MGFIELFLIAIGLSMDAFAVAVCKGIKMQKLNIKQTAIISLFFGGFQALMPFIGWAIGTGFEKYIKSVDHWIAFFLLAFIGGKMDYESFKAEDVEDSGFFDLKELTVMAIATSIDALAVGIAFATLSMKLLDISLAVLLIGVTTFVLSALGVFIGHKFGASFKNKAELAGGIILILIGLKILLEHLGLIAF